MPRRKLIRQDTFPYHVTSRTNHKEWFKIPIYEVWDICKTSLNYAVNKCPVKIHCFVLMYNHYHMLISTPDANIDIFMRLFNLKLSKLITKASRLINHKFSNRYKWTIVDNESYLFNVYRYIYQNPVRAKITKDCYSYPYSSLHFSRYESRSFKHQPHIYYAKEKAWIEKQFGSDFNNQIKIGLNRDRFRPNDRISKYHLRILQRPKS